MFSPFHLKKAAVLSGRGIEQSSPRSGLLLPLDQCRLSRGILSSIQTSLLVHQWALPSTIVPLILLSCVRRASSPHADASGRTPGTPNPSTQASRGRAKGLLWRRQRHNFGSNLRLRCSRFIQDARSFGVFLSGQLSRDELATWALSSFLSMPNSLCSECLMVLGSLDMCTILTALE